MMVRMSGRAVVRVGLLGRTRAGACPNLVPRRCAAGSAARRSAEYQRFYSSAPARWGPLQQIWTNRAAAGPGRGAAGSDGDHGRCPDVHFALESAVPTVILECKMHHSRAKCTSRRAGDRRPRPGHRRPRPRPGASPVTLREGAQRSLPHRKQWPGGRDRRDPGPAQTRTRLAPCEPGATKSTSARAMRAQRDEIRLRSIRASPPGTMRSQVTSPKRLPPGRARVASAGSSPPGRARAASFREGAEVSRPLGGREVVGPLVAGALRAHRVPAAARRDGGGRPAAGAVDDVGASHIPHGR